jgi:chromate transporter
MSFESSSRYERLLELARLFLKLGTTAFGGPAAHIAMMEDEVVRRRQWLTHEEFLDMLGATNLIPGPNSTEMAIHIGHRRAGWLGLLVAGSCFILPAALIVSVIAWGYVHFGKLPKVEGILYGVKPIIITVVLQALWRLGRSALKTKWLAVIGIVAAALNFLGVNELIILFATGLFVVARNLFQRNCVMPMLRIVPAVPFAITSAAASFGLWPLFLFFLKVGSVLFGSGYVLLAFLRADLVDRWHWLTASQLLDAIAVGQITPGPVFTTATFIGFILSGTLGATVATIGIFLPAFFFVAISGLLVPRLRRSPLAGAFLNGLNVASLALMAVVTWQLGRVAVCDWMTTGLVIVSGFLLLRFRINPIWLVIVGAAIGLATSLLRG